jgi:hypothetical protein
MKRTYGLLLLSVVLTACGGNEEVAGAKSTITGTYVRQAESEYSKAMDTLIITPYDAKAGTFIIIQRTGFHRIKDGRLQPKENKQERMITVWDEETHQLQELKKGKLYTFPATGRELLAGTAKYLKIE